MTIEFEAPGEISPRETQNGSDLCAGGSPPAARRQA